MHIEVGKQRDANSKRQITERKITERQTTRCKQRDANRGKQRDADNDEHFEMQILVSDRAIGAKPGLFVNIKHQFSTRSGLFVSL